MYHRTRILCLLIVLIFVTNVFPVSAAQKAPPAKGAYPQPLGRTAIVMDAGSGRVLYSNNDHQRMPPASVTKIMTALLVVENGDLDKEVQVSEHAAKTPESSIYLQPGEVLTRWQLLFACMLHSANDAATALAESVAGNEPAFVAMMNQRAQQLGLQDTHFCNPHGLETSGHYTSAYDLAIITRQALTNASFRQVVATRNILIPWAGHSENRSLWNQNRLLYRYPQAIGVKTGYTKQAGNCVVGAAQRGDMVLIAISMNSPQVYEDLEQMLDYGFTHYQLVTIEKSSQVAVQVNVVMGEAPSVNASLASDLVAAVTPEEKQLLSYKVCPTTQVLAPVKAGDIVGTCQIFLRGTEIGRVNLLATGSVAKKISMAQIFGQYSWYFLAGLILLLMLNRKLRIRRRRRW
ncbi:MAG TPA: D-alanyl-D-alanine carboxypeptidase family protein [Syntrophomonadaceae bacterium]|nr:D-alanyl-D-alanine carboxypeptidase family protein [Syntrophomonadaceae bacterium]